MHNNDEDNGYPFGVYLCTCGLLYIWYPDSKKDKNLDMYPETINCECGRSVEITEKLRVKDIWTDLVPLFIKVSHKYTFKKLLMIDEEHVHLVWQTGNKFPDFLH
ncbi:MAG: hypothetical protein ACTSRG_01415 [Candidatus Helarchaeota archaeon]